MGSTLRYVLETSIPVDWSMLQKAMIGKGGLPFINSQVVSIGGFRRAGGAGKLRERRERGRGSDPRDCCGDGGRNRSYTIFS